MYRHLPTMMERRVQAEYLDHIRSFAWLELFFCRRLNSECSLAVFPFMFGSAGPAGFGTTGCGSGASASSWKTSSRPGGVEAQPLLWHYIFFVWMRTCAQIQPSGVCFMTKVVDHLAATVPEIAQESEKACFWAGFNPAKVELRM